MGRPLHKKYFANTNYATTGEGVGGEGVASVTVVTGDSDAYDAEDAVTFTAPQIAGGQTATGTIVVDENGAVTGITVTNAGSGYTSAPTVSITTSTGTETTLSLTAVLTSGASARQNGIAAYAFVTGGSNKLGDIIEQVGSRRYKVRTADGTMVCTLVTDGVANAAGEMTITATDSDDGTYFVKKLTARKAVLVRNSGTAFATGASVKWTFGSAVEGVSVTIANN